MTYYLLCCGKCTRCISDSPRALFLLVRYVVLDIIRQRSLAALTRVVVGTVRATLVTYRKLPILSLKHHEYINRYGGITRGITK